jgi:hypothetical protein
MQALVTLRVVFPLADHWSLAAAFEAEYAQALATLAGAPTVLGESCKEGPLAERCELALVVTINAERLLGKNCTHVYVLQRCLLTLFRHPQIELCCWEEGDQRV